MTKSKLEVYDLAALEAFAPRCVETVTTKKPVMANIRAALKVHDTVPGVRVIAEGAEQEDKPAADLPEGMEVPEFVGRKA